MGHQVVSVGRRRYKAAVEARKKPKLQLDGLGLQTRALGDLWNSLGHRQCHVIVDRVIHTGQVDTWRFPVLLPADMQLWEAGGVFQYALASEKLLG